MKICYFTLDMFKACAMQKTAAFADEKKED